MTSGKRTSRPRSSGFKEIALSLIDHPEEIARMAIDLDYIRELADSIRVRGLLQPILVHPKGDRYGIIAGDRRFMAHELLGLKKIMCRIRNVSGKEIIIERAVENIQREDLTPFEEAHIYQGLKEKEGMAVDEISKVVGKSPGIVERRLAILRMPDSFQKAVHEGKVNLSVAEELWSCPDEAKREYFLGLAIEHGITTAVARMWVSDFRKEIRSSERGEEVGRGGPMSYVDVPIYRACDICRGPCDYSKIRELRICPTCNEAIVAVLPKQS